jgi:hypothetical protein
VSEECWSCHLSSSCMQRPWSQQLARNNFAKKSPPQPRLGTPVSRHRSDSKRETSPREICIATATASHCMGTTSGVDGGAQSELHEQREMVAHVS